ncbi:Type II secretion system protein G (plasmid) [Asticcacaulis sp. MM231]|uniref:type II secretion system major pseudopilin GspG n=1 Tax=Asticcacaulis sp. MM231 TaxID=3157666 RepID=UPI0032D598F5
MNRDVNDDDGYTLTEMLVVIVIIALIAAVLTPSLLGQLSRARAKTATLQLDTTSASLEMFKDDTGRFPTQEEGLGALVADPGIEGWLGPYLKSAKSVNDPWGHPITYAISADGAVSITSLGADGKTGGKGVDADISVALK